MVVLERGSYVALVVDLDSLLLLCMRMRAGLEHEPINRGEDQEFPDKGHLIQ